MGESEAEMDLHPETNPFILHTGDFTRLSPLMQTGVHEAE